MIYETILAIALSGAAAVGQPVADNVEYGFNGKYRIPPPPKDSKLMEKYELFLNEIKFYPGRERWTKREWDQLKQRSTKTPLVPAGLRFGVQNDGLDTV